MSLWRVSLEALSRSGDAYFLVREVADVWSLAERILAPPDTLPDSDGDAFAPLVARLTDGTLVG